MKLVRELLCDKWFLGCVCWIVLVVGLSAQYHGWSKQRIENWSQSHHYKMTDLKRVYWGTPFWQTKGSEYFKADLKKDGVTKTSYFRVTILGVTQRWPDGSSDD